MSPSHRDTKGKVKGFHTGSSVYLITCRTARGQGGLGPGDSRALASDVPSGDGAWPDGQTHSRPPEDGSGHPCGRDNKSFRHHHAPRGTALSGAAGRGTRWLGDTQGPTHPPLSCGPASTCRHPPAYKTRGTGLTSQRGPGGTEEAAERGAPARASWEGVCGPAASPAQCLGEGGLWSQPAWHPSPIPPPSSVGSARGPELLQPLGPAASPEKAPHPGFPRWSSETLRAELREQEASIAGQAGFPKGDCSRGEGRGSPRPDVILAHCSGNPRKWQLSQTHCRWDVTSF